MYNSDITSISCESHPWGPTGEYRVCIAEVTLLARFFADANPVALTITGVVDIVHGGDTAGRALYMTKQNIVEESVVVLSSSESGHRSVTIADSGNQDKGGFSLKVEITKTDADTSAGPNQYGSSGLLSLAAGAAGAVLLV